MRCRDSSCGQVTASDRAIHYQVTRDSHQLCDGLDALRILNKKTSQSLTVNHLTSTKYDLAWCDADIRLFEAFPNFTGHGSKLTLNCLTIFSQLSLRACLQLLKPPAYTPHVLCVLSFGHIANLNELALGSQLTGRLFATVGPLSFCSRTVSVDISLDSRQISPKPLSRALKLS